VEATHRPSRPRKALGVPVALSQHPYERFPQRPVLLAVDQEFSEPPALWVASELADPVGPVEVGQYQDMEKLGAGSRSQGIEPFTELPLDVLQVREANASTHCGSSTSADGD
jgi:hypothetical protein